MANFDQVFAECESAPRVVSSAPSVEPAPPVFVGGKPRSAEYLLDYPILYDGRTYDAITMRRPTQREFGAFMDVLLAGGPAPFPVFYAADGTPVPAPVIEQLDQDDSDRIMERLAEFLPNRLLRLAEAVIAPGATVPDETSAAAPATA